MTPRILSLVPAATEWVGRLGLADHLVGVTSACEVPAGADPAVVVTPALALDPADPAGVDRAVTDAGATGRPLYELDEAAVAAAEPTVVLTQRLCDVCAVPEASLARLAETLGGVAVVGLDGVTLPGVLADGRRVGDVCGAEQAARDVVDRLRARLAAVERAVAGRPRPAVGCVEWPDPVWLAGHWVPDQVAAAGGRCVAGRSGEPSRRGSWSDLAEAEVTVVAPCGFDLHEAADAAETVPGGRAPVWAVDARRAFSRPSGGLVDGVEALAAICHPSACGEPERHLAREVRASAEASA